MADEAVVEKGKASVGKGWLGCMVGAFALTAILFWLPWGKWLAGVGGSQEGEVFSALIFKGFMLALWPLHWLVSTAGYATAGTVGLAISLAAILAFPEENSLKKWKETAIGLSFSAGVFVFAYGVVGLQNQANDRALDFAKSSVPSGVFKVIDTLNPGQVQAVREGLTAGANPEVLFERATKTAGLNTGYKNTFFYAPNYYKSGLGASFLTLFAEKDSGVMSGPVCERVRQNYLKSAVTDRYELSINDVVVDASSGSCKPLTLNKVEMSYRGIFAAP